MVQRPEPKLVFASTGRFPEDLDFTLVTADAHSRATGRVHLDGNISPLRR